MSERRVMLCERRLWVAWRDGVNGGYYTCGGRIDGDACRKCGSAVTLPSETTP